jgi:hypothetical protein
MKLRLIEILILICYVLLILTVVSCGHSRYTQVIRENCTVQETEEGATIFCPDGTSVTIENATVTVVLPEPVVCPTPTPKPTPKPKKEKEHGHE